MTKKIQSIVIIDKANYLQKMRNILSDSSKFTEVFVGNEKQLNFLDNLEKQVTDLLKQLKYSCIISDTVYKNLKARGSRFGILYRFFRTYNN